MFLPIWFMIVVSIPFFLFNNVSESNFDTLLYELINVSLPSNLKEWLKQNDLLIAYVLTSITKLVGLALSLSLTINIFVYRERRSISPSHNKSLRKNFIFLVFLYTPILITFIYGSIFSFYISELNLVEASQKINFFNTPTLARHAFIYVYLLFLSLTLSIFIFRSIIRNIDLEYQLENKIQDIYFTSTQLSICIHQNNNNIPKSFKNNLDSLIFSVESLFQVFSYLIKNNLMDLYNRKIKEWNDVVDDFSLGLEVHKKKTNIIMFEHLREIDGDRFASFYTSLLEGHMQLIDTIFSQHKFEISNENINVFFDYLALTSNAPKNIRNIYFSEIHKLLLIIFINHPVGFKLTLDKFSKFNQASLIAGVDDFHVIYEDLLFKSLEQDDLNSVIDLCYSMLSVIERSSIKPQGIAAKMRRFQERQQNKLFENYRENIAHTILKLLVKGIERSNHSITGFLVKFIVTNFSNDNLLDLLLLEIRSDLKSSRNVDRVRSELYIKPFYNDQTLEYCINKLIILIYLQQSFSIKSKLKFINNGSIKVINANKLLGTVKNFV